MNLNIAFSVESSAPGIHMLSLFAMERTNSTVKIKAKCHKWKKTSARSLNDDLSNANSKYIHVEYIEMEFASWVIKTYCKMIHRPR